MSFFTSFLIAVGLSADAFAVSLTSGMALRRPRPLDALRIALAFGIFQAAMPVVGWLAGIGMKDLIAGFDHWVALGLLGLIGGKMIDEGIRGRPCDATVDAVPMSLWTLLVLAVATSIDALAVGVTFSVLVASIALPVTIIGTTTFVASFAGVFLGDRCARLFERKVEIIGGLILIGIGLRILIDHIS